MEEAGTHMAEITEFVPLEAVDPVYFDKAYYLAPDKGGAKPYALLAQRVARIEALRARALGRARQAVHRDDPPGRGRPRHAAAALRRRGAVDEGPRDPEDRREAGRAEARAAADRAADIRHVRSRRSTPTTWRRASRPRCRRRSRARRSRWPRRPKAGRAGHRSHGSAAREPREEGARARDLGQARRRGACDGDAQARQARAAGRAAATPAARKAAKK